MTETIKKQGIYIAIDALLDTRLATIFLHDKNLVPDILKSNYFNREIDDFKGIDREIFKSLYAVRNKLTLKDSIITRCVILLKEIVSAMVQQAVSSPFHSGPKIFLNTYPYKLDKDEEKIILSALVQVTGKLADIQLVHMTNEDLTPSFLKDNLAVLLMYEYGSWLDAQAENFKKKPCPEISVIVPGIYFDRLPTKDELEEALEKQMHPFKAIEYMSSVMIGLKLHDVELFSASIK